MKSLTWLITGASRGIGKVLASQALEAGHRVAATARNLQDLQDLATQWPQTCLPLQADMDNASTLHAAVSATLLKWGKIEVLVNNAGYGLQSMIEEATPDQVRRQMETNFFGLVEMTRAVLPAMRHQRDGYIVNLSSIAGLRGSPGFGYYNASKFAVEGFSEALAAEVAPFGIRVSIVEPGPYRTDWAGNSLQRSEAMQHEQADSPYREQNQKFKAFMDSRNGNQPGDPQQIAAVLLQAAQHPQPPLHMVFGDIAISLWNDRLQQYHDEKFMKHYPHHQNQL